MADIILPTVRRVDILLIVPSIVAALDTIEPMQFLQLD